MSPDVRAGLALVIFDNRSFMSARPDLAAEAPRLASRLDGMPWMSATVFRGRSRLGFLPVADFVAALGAAFFRAAFFGAAFFFGLPAEALAEVGAAFFLATARFKDFFLADFFAGFRAAFFIDFF